MQLPILSIITQIYCVTLLVSTAQSGKVTCVTSVTRSSRLGSCFCSGQLIFEDNFNSFNLSKWQHEITMAGGGNNEFQVYWNKSQNSFIENGILYIKPGKLADIYGEPFLSSGTLDLGSKCTASWNNGCTRTGDAVNILPPATSARLHTINSFSFKYGKVEVRAKMPAGDWIWPAIWMLPWQSVYGPWPASGEIDILESRGNRDLRSNGGQIGVNQALSTMHWGPNPSLNRFMNTAYYKNLANGTGYNEDFHLFQIKWTPDFIEFSIDNISIGKVTPPSGGFWELGNFTNLNNIWINGTKLAPFDQEFFLILNVAIGGTKGYFPDTAINAGGKPWLNNSPQPFLDFWRGRTSWEPTWKLDNSTAMQVDYVRVWAL